MKLSRLFFIGLQFLILHAAQAESHDNMRAETRQLIEKSMATYSSSKPEALRHAFRAIHLADSLREQILLGDAFHAAGFIYYRAGKPDSSIHFLQRALDIRQNTGDSLAIGQTLNRMGNASWSVGNQLKAKKLHEQALSYLEPGLHYKEMGQVLNNLANINRNWGNYDKALQLYTRALENYEKVDFKEGMAWLNFSLTIFFKTLGNYKSALESVNKSLEIYSRMAEGNTDSTGIMLCFGQLGDLYLQLEQYKTGLKYHLAALRMRRKTGVQPALADGLSGVGQAYYYLGQYDKAIAYIQESMNIQTKILNRSMLSTNLKYLGYIYDAKGEPDRAMQYLNRGLKISRDKKANVNRKDIIKKISDIYAAAGDYRKAHTYQDAYIALSDSLLNSEVTNRVSSMQIIYEMKEKMFENERLSKDNRIKQLQIEKSHSVRNYLIYIVIIFISAILIIINLYLSERKANRLLEQKNQEIDNARRRLEEEIEERRQIEFQREELIVELKNSMKAIKTLSGLIPICAHCKNIRNDQGYYEQLEEYIMSHSNAVFSHGICPDCAETLYGSYIKKRKKAGDD